MEVHVSPPWICHKIWVSLTSLPIPLQPLEVIGLTLYKTHWLPTHTVRFITGCEQFQFISFWCRNRSVAIEWHVSPFCVPS
jgi:hypothetical protein